MDLALVTGRGDPLGTEWPGVEGPLIADADVIQLGERESRDADWPLCIIRTQIHGRLGFQTSLAFRSAGERGLRKAFSAGTRQRRHYPPKTAVYERNGRAEVGSVTARIGRIDQWAYG